MSINSVEAIDNHIHKGTNQSSIFMFYFYLAECENEQLMSTNSTYIQDKNKLYKRKVVILVFLITRAQHDLYFSKKIIGYFPACTF